MSTENQQIFTVAYITELDTSQFVTLTAAEAGAEVARHIRRFRAGASERTSVGTLSNASDISPSGSERGDVGHEAWGRGSGAGRGLREIAADGVASREGRNRAADTNVLLGNLSGECASMGLVLVDVRLQNLASVDVAVHVVAVVHSILQDTDFPTVQEVTVVRKEALVAGGEHVGAVAPVVVAIGRNDHLVENRDRVDRVRRRAGATVVVVDGVGHVRLVIGAVKVLAVPALREEDLDTDAVLAGVDVWEVDVLALGIGRIIRDGATVI